ncbi:hypothetical protein NYV52_00615 [Escherichia coli]|uniref:hypothetical protein n=1 Tax=Escherichia coli TaxID=562 RepID=UPI0022283F52|nr:hypothetical protein [Escherichia coli]MCW3308284.1 hypothetical protein [Escherichia coli]MCW7081099.1 hypothetical protein [Escherichia coli]
MIKNVALFALQPFQRQTGRHIVKDTHFLMKRRNNSGKFSLSIRAGFFCPNSAAILLRTSSIARLTFWA